MHLQITNALAGRSRKMFFKILKKDLKRSKTMNIILFLFIILATVFVSSGLSNLLSVINGMDYFVDQAVGDKSDYVVLAPLGDSEDKTDKILKESKAIKSYDKDRFYLYTDEVFDSEGKKIMGDNALYVASPKTTFIKLFDSNNKEVTEVKKGHIYLSVKFLTECDLKQGDKIKLLQDKEEKEYIIDGGVKDAVMGSSITGVYRVVMSDEDAEELNNTEDADKHQSQVIYIETDDIKSVSQDISNIEGANTFSGSLIVITRMLDIMIAFIIVILSICLILVSFVILRFSIGFTIQDDFREIGVMKALGIRNFKIRSLYLVKYTALTLVGTVIGCIISIPFGNMLMDSVTESLMLGNTYGELINVFGAVLVFAVILWLAFISTGKVKKMTPVDAIRSGETGERFKKKRGKRISKSHAKNYAYMAWNDILSSPKRYLNIVISFGVCTLFLLIMSNFTATLDSNAFIDTFSIRGDLYMSGEHSQVLDVQELIDKYSDVPGIDKLKDMEHIGIDTLMDYDNGKEIYEDYLNLMEDKLAEEGMPAKICTDAVLVYKFRFKGEEYPYAFIQTIGEKGSEYPMIEGTAPQNKNEVAVTVGTSENYDIKIGDTIEVIAGDHTEKCTVTGIFQSMNNMGSLIRIKEDFHSEIALTSGWVCNIISFTDNPTQEEIEARRVRLYQIFTPDKIQNQRDFSVGNMGALDAMKAVELLLMAITIIVVILVTVMMERSFIAKENKQIAILKAVGFRDRDVIKWQVTRFGILAVVAVVFAIVVSIPLTDFTGNAIFKSMGAAAIKYVHSVESLLKYPVIIVGVTLLITWITSLYTGTVKARDTASIE